MKAIVQPLGTLLKTVPLNKVLFVLNSFHCKKDNNCFDEDIENAMHPLPKDGRIPVIEWDNLGVMKTYLVIDSTKKWHEDNFLLGYFSIAISCINVGSQLGTIFRSSPAPYEGFKKRPIRSALPCMMLVLFAKNASAVDYSFSDAYTSFLMPIICEIKNKIGGTLLVLDCEANHSDLVQYYKKKSFVPIHIGDNDKSGLEKMILRI